MLPIAHYLEKNWREFLAGKFVENFGGKMLAGKCWRENVGGKILAGTFGAKVLVEKCFRDTKIVAT
jgi:hypothetical protein